VTFTVRASDSSKEDIGIPFFGFAYDFDALVRAATAELSRPAFKLVMDGRRHDRLSFSSFAIRRMHPRPLIPGTEAFSSKPGHEVAAHSIEEGSVTKESQDSLTSFSL
jgi:hypothetical protein